MRNRSPTPFAHKRQRPSSPIRGKSLIGISFVVAAIAVAQTSPQGGNAGATQVANPVAATRESIAAGQEVYTRFCAGCHGVKGDGKGTAAGEYGKKPADLTRPKLGHGSSDAQTFDVIKNGVQPDLFMPAWDGQISDSDIWNVINYLHTLRQQ